MEVKELEREFNPDFLRNMLKRLDWDAFIAAATTVILLCMNMCVYLFLQPFHRYNNSMKECKIKGVQKHEYKHMH